MLWGETCHSCGIAVVISHEVEATPQRSATQIDQRTVRLEATFLHEFQLPGTHNLRDPSNLFMDVRQVFFASYIAPAMAFVLGDRDFILNMQKTIS